MKSLKNKLIKFVISNVGKKIKDIDDFKLKLQSAISLLSFDCKIGEIYELNNTIGGDILYMEESTPIVITFHISISQ